MTVEEVMKELESMGSEQTRKTFTRHGCISPMFGVKVGDMKKTLKKIKKNTALARELWDTGNSDAQYLAGLAALPSELTKEDFENWADSATWYMVSEYALAWNLAESPLCLEICEKWRNSPDVNRQQIAWAALASYLIYEKRPPIDEAYFSMLVNEVEQKLQKSANRVRYTMNGFLISLGSSEPGFYEMCKKVAKNIGKVEVNVGDTACKVPEAIPYLEKIKGMNRLGYRKKTVKC